MLSPQLLGLLRRNRHCPNHLHFTPTSASWINQVERFFALLTEKQIRRGVHRPVDELDQRSTALSRRTTKRQSPSGGRNPLTRSLPASNAFEWPEPINGY